MSQAISDLLETSTRIRKAALVDSLNRAQVALAERGDPDTGRLSSDDLNAYLDLARLKEICEGV